MTLVRTLAMRLQWICHKWSLASNCTGFQPRKEKSKRASLIASLCPGQSPNKKVECLPLSAWHDPDCVAVQYYSYKTATVHSLSVSFCCRKTLDVSSCVRVDDYTSSRHQVCKVGWTQLIISPPQWDRLVGLVVKASASGAEDLGFESCFWLDFSGSSHTIDLRNWHSSGYPARHLAL